MRHRIRVEIREKLCGVGSGDQPRVATLSVAVTSPSKPFHWPRKTANRRKGLTVSDRPSR